MQRVLALLPQLLQQRYCMPAVRDGGVPGKRKKEDVRAELAVDL
jgi:hypothetical protein